MGGRWLGWDKTRGGLAQVLVSNIQRKNATEDLQAVSDPAR